ncbi:hypothetical protein SH2C18_18130 [Clostridium sediminicola]|uniref:hypothetical protein n=1 Tax=Clostridium sediminicola TaxID=3114879 RepID=UPI0031F1EC41
MSYCSCNTCYNKSGKYYESKKSNICSCFKEMEKILRKLQGQEVEITTKSDIKAEGIIQCVNGFLVNILEEKWIWHNRRWHKIKRNVVIPIAQIAEVRGYGVDCACKECCRCGESRRKECCCGENDLAKFLLCKSGYLDVTLEGGEQSNNLLVSCVTDHLVVFKDEDNQVYKLMYLCCITEVIDVPPPYNNGGYGLSEVADDEDVLQIEKEIPQEDSEK